MHPSKNVPPQQSTVTLLDGQQWLYIQEKFGLTGRERQIAELVCQGLGNTTIARSLKIRPGTVKTHIRNIYRKLRVRSKINMLLAFVAEARSSPDEAARWRSLGLVD